MWRFGYDEISSFLLVMALLTMLVAIFVWQRHRTQKTMIVWLSAGVVGILLGSIGSFAAVRFCGYTVVAGPRATLEDVGAENEGDSEEDMGGMDSGMGGGMGAEGGGGGGGGRPGMGGGAGGGMFGGPRPKRDMATLVRKIELLTGDVALSLTTEQGASLLEALEEAQSAEAMSDDDAKVIHDKIVALFDEQQNSRLEAISLPRGPRPGGGRGPGGSPPDEQANPLREEANAGAVDSLRARFAATDAE